MVLCFLLFQFQSNFSTITAFEVAKKFALLLLLVGSLLVTNFITKRNGLSKDNSYTFLLFFVFLILFPKTLSNSSLIISNTFILLAFRRLISLQSLKSPKEKIFDASIWIFTASLFHFWAILFIILVFVSIIFHVSRDYRNWIIPFIAFFTVSIIAILSILIFDANLLNNFISQIRIDFDLKYIKTIFQNIALAIYIFTSMLALVTMDVKMKIAKAIYIFTSMLALVTMVLMLKRKSLNMQASYKKIILAYVIGLVVFFISPDKDNSSLIFTFVPVSIMLTNYLETIEKYWIKETILGTIILASVITFILQLL